MTQQHSRATRSTLALGLAGLAFCAATAAAPATLPPSHEQNGIWYLSGGYGCHEAAAIRSVAPSYPLALSFYAQGAQRRLYLARVQVTIRDADGATVFATEAEGPLLLVRLPAGRYHLDAEYKGDRRTMDLQIVAGQHRALAIALRDDDADLTQPSAHEREVCA